MMILLVKGEKMTKRITIKTEAAAIAYLTDSETRIPRTIERDGTTYVVESAACGRCGGSGNGGWYPDGGICYECNGVDTSGRTKSTALIPWARAKRAAEMATRRRDRKYAAKKAADEVSLLEGQRRWCAANTAYGAVTFEERDALRNAERNAKKAEATYLDVPVKKRVTMNLTLVDTFSWDGHFGTTILYKWIAPCGASVVWRTSDTSSSHWIDGPDGFERPPNKGETITAKFTVKDHSEYRGEKQTAVNRLVASGLVTIAAKEAA